MASALFYFYTGIQIDPFMVFYKGDFGDPEFLGEHLGDLIINRQRFEELGEINEGRNILEISILAAEIGRALKNLPGGFCMGVPGMINMIGSFTYHVYLEEDHMMFICRNSFTDEEIFVKEL